MQLSERDRDEPTSSVEASTEEGPALSGAALVADRIANDEADATAARERFRDGPVPSIHPDDGIAPHLLPGEVVHNLRRHAILRAPGDDRALGYGGTLYLTSQRLIHLGQVKVIVQLSDIVETSLSGERLLLSLRDGEGLALELDRPRLLRAELAAATRCLRS